VIYGSACKQNDSGFPALFEEKETIEKEDDLFVRFHGNLFRRRD
jgi:hypothetical protein